MNEQAATAAIKTFKQTLDEYKKILDDDIAEYSRQNKKSTLQNYGANARLAADAYLSILERGGKRIRGALVMVGYEMCGGKNREMIIQAARAIEMIHAYILIIDDIQDRSQTRRGGASAHVLLSEHHRKKQLADDEYHFGVSIALNSALLGNHAAQMVMANLDVDPELRNSVLSILNRGMVITAHGQTNDIMNEVVAEVSDEDVDRVLEWKTAHYTFLNPLHVGMILAGAECHSTNAITEYSMNAGRAFQITDDILGIFGSEFESGKSPMDDLREGKRTVLTLHALKNAKSADKNFLIQMLGNHNLTPTEFLRCRDIIIETGSLDYATKQAKQLVDNAIKSLAKNDCNWSEEGLTFLRGLAAYLLTRQS